MSLRKKTLGVPLVGGLERRNGGEDLTANLTELPATPRALNLYRPRTGEWAPRPGHTAVALAAGMTGFTGGGSVGEQLVLTTPQFIYSKGASQAAFTAHSPAASFAGRASLIQGALQAELERTAVKALAVAAGGGAIVTVTESTTAASAAWSEININALRTEDGAAVTMLTAGAITSGGAGTINSQARVRALYSSATGKFVVLYTLPDVAATALNVVVVTAATLFTTTPFSAFGTATAIATDLVGSGTSVNAHFDAMVEQDTGAVVIAYRGTGSNTRAIRFDPSTTTVTTGPVTVVAGGDVAANSLAWCRTDEFPATSYTLVTAINSATGIVARTITKTTLAQSASVTIQASPGAVGSVCGYRSGTAATTNAIMWDVTNAATQRSAINTKYFLSGSWQSSHEMQDLVGCRLHGHPFVYMPSNASYRWAVPVVTSVQNEGKLLFVAPLSTGTTQPLLAAMLGGETETAPAADGNLMEVTSYGGEFFYGAIERTGQNGDATVAVTSRHYYSTIGHVLRLAISDVRANFVMLDPDTGVIPGAFWTKYSSDQDGGAPWPPAPAPPPSGLAEVAGGSAVGGLVRIRTCLVITDAKGRRWQGAPSDESTFTLSGVSTAVEGVYNQMPSLYCGNARLEVFRSKPASTQFFRDFFVSYADEAPGSSHIVASAATDAQLEQGLPLYTDAGELFHEAPPPSNCAWVAGTRLLVADAQKPGTIWASSEFTPGEGPWFHPDVAISLPTSAEILAGAHMDGRSFIFTRKEIFALAGSWPGRTGLGQLPEAQRVATGVGGYSPQSTLVTKEGIWFYSEDRGLCLLDRGMAVQMPGKSVDGVVTTAPVATIQVEKYDQVRSYFADGTVVVYDQLERQWSYWTIGGLGGNTITCAFVHGRDVYIGTSGALVLKEDASATTDNGTAFTMGLDLRVPIGPPGGKVRIYQMLLAGLRTADATLTATLFNDFGNVGSGEETKIIEVRGTPGETTPGMYRVTFKPRRGRCESMLLRLSYPSTDGRLTFRSLAIEVGGYKPATVARLGPGKAA